MRVACSWAYSHDSDTVALIDLTTRNLVTELSGPDSRLRPAGVGKPCVAFEANG